MYVELLRSINQDHIADAYQAASEEAKKALDAQITKI
jgi:hypothetical protein